MTSSLTSVGPRPPVSDTTPLVWSVCVGILEEYVCVRVRVRVWVAGRTGQGGRTHHDPGRRRMNAEHPGRHLEDESFNQVNILSLSLSGALSNYMSHGTRSGLNLQDLHYGSFSLSFLSFPFLSFFSFFWMGNRMLLVRADLRLIHWSSHCFFLMWKVLNQSFPSALQSFRPVPCPLNADLCGRPGLWVCSKHVCVGISGIQTNFLSGKGARIWPGQLSSVADSSSGKRPRVALSAPAMEFSHLFPASSFYLTY